jgi:lysozyme
LLNIWDSLFIEIKKEEGFRGDPYYDHLGFQTIGYGTKLPIDKEEAELLLKNRLHKMQKELNSRIKKTYGNLNLPDEAWEILDHMAYQLGVSGVMNFKKMLSALAQGHYRKASEEMLDSRWASQTPQRAMRLSTRMAYVI